MRLRRRPPPPPPQWPDNLELPSLAPIPENPAVIVKTYGKARATNREALAAALDPAVRDYGWLHVLEQAAKERFAQLPEVCECQFQHPDALVAHRFSESACRGSGKVYPADIVKRIRDVLRPWDLNIESTEAAIAVLDALNEERAT